MRTNIKIVGLGKRMIGTSKTGKEYDFTPVSFTYPDGYTTGVKAVTCNVSGDMIDAVGGLQIDTEYDAVIHTVNRNTYVDAIL